MVLSGKIDFAFVHGGGQGGWIWEKTIAAMREQDGGGVGALLALDAPGCGSKRSRNTDGLAMIDVVDDFIADIEEAGLERVVLVGHSQAGQPLPMLARKRPDLVHELVYVSCSAPVNGQSVERMMGASLRGRNEEEVGWPIDPTVSSMKERFSHLFCNDMSKEQREDFLARLGKDMWPIKTYSESDWLYDDFGGVPASYVICLRDQALPPAWQHVFADRLKVEARFSIDAGHQVMNSRPRSLAETLLLDVLPRTRRVIPTPDNPIASGRQA